MSGRTVYIRSALGAFIQSPLGARICNTYLTITTVPLYLEDGTVYGILGYKFGATQGTGTLIISNTPAGDDIAVTQTVTTWADDEITFTFDAGTIPGGSVVWVEVTSDNGQNDVATTYFMPPAGTVTDPGTVIFANNQLICSLETGQPEDWQAAYACATVFSSFPNWRDLGYVTAMNYSEGLKEAVVNSPGVTFVGALSELIFDPGPLIISASRHTYCSPSEGLAAVIDGSGVEIFRSVAAPPLTPPTCPSHGWTDTEDVYFIPKYPVSIGVITPADATIIPYYDDVSLSAYAYDSAGSIATDIDWQSDIDGVLGTGSSVTTSLSVGTHMVEASVQNSQGQRRYSHISITVDPLAIGEVFPLVGSEGGGQRVLVFGLSFRGSVEVYFDGNAATGLVLISGSYIQGVAPAGAGAALVEVVDGAVSDESVDPLYTYDVVENVSIKLVTPATGTVAGGTACEIIGTGFDADFVVYFGYYNLLADSIVYNEDKEYYASDFSASVDGWTGTNGTASGNIDGVSGNDNVLRLTIGGAGGVTNLARSSSFVLLVENHLLISVYVPAGQSYVDGFRVYSGDNTTGTLLYDGAGENGAWVDIELAEIPSDASIRVYAVEVTSETIDAAASGEFIYVTGVFVGYKNIEFTTPVGDAPGPVWVHLVDEITGRGDIEIDGFEYT